MKTHEIILLLFTFVVGASAGAYYYLTAFAPTFANIDFTPETEFVIVGKEYGDTVEVAQAPSFRLVSDGRYRFLPATTGPEGDVTTGQLDRTLLRQLRRTLQASDIDALTTPVSEAVCDPRVVPLAKRYEITIAEQTFILDTCMTTFSDTTELATLLDLVWREMRGSPTNVSS